MNCPKCNAAMNTVQHEGVEIERCSGCAGLWFDAFEHEELKELTSSASVDSAPAESSSSHAGGTGACPKCTAKMIQMVVASQPHISYESCPTCHGVFFDAGEFADFRDETFSEKFRDYFKLARRLS